MVWMWRPAPRSLGSKNFVMTYYAHTLQWSNSKRYLSVCVSIVQLWLSCTTAKIISPFTLELSRFSTCFVSLFECSSVLTSNGSYMFPIFKITCGAFRRQSFYIRLSDELNSEYNWTLIHTARYASLYIIIVHSQHSPTIVLWNTW